LNLAPTGRSKPFYWLTLMLISLAILKKVQEY
jgi:hypothetical protein